MSDHLPPGARKIACLFSANKLVDLKDYVSMLPADELVVFAIGGFAHGDLMGLEYHQSVRENHHVSRFM